MCLSIDRTFIALALMLLAGSVRPQDEALTRDFEKLSAKERARIAREEQEAAQRDVAYQAVMTEAESLFQQSRYEESMEKFKEARGMRPYNVYPKVKIQDLQALIARRDKEQVGAGTAVPPSDEQQVEATAVPPTTRPDTTVERPDPIPGPDPDRGSAMGTGEQRTASSAPEPVIAPVGPSAIAEEPIRAPREKGPGASVGGSSMVPAPPQLDEGERVYKEGRSVVVEQRIKEDGRLVVYRKVSHPWGQIDHFRDGIAVTGRVYEKALEGR